ncbi:MAG: hypothetical protein J0M15_15525, partial [Deltaproteobacteria bacterium]|nr:hypothetical protein [Deltaproteobacteria bacterium]
MEQNQNNYITLEMNLKLQMVCGARHNICYGKRWIMWTVLLVKVIPSLYGHIATHKSDTALPPSDVPSYS